MSCRVVSWPSVDSHRLLPHTPPRVMALFRTGLQTPAIRLCKRRVVPYYYVCIGMHALLHDVLVRDCTTQYMSAADMTHDSLWLLCRARRTGHQSCPGQGQTLGSSLIATSELPRQALTVTSIVICHDKTLGLIGRHAAVRGRRRAGNLVWRNAGIPF